MPDDEAYAGRIGPYLGSVLPHYAANFMDWWRDRLRPEIERNFAYLDSFDMDGADLTALAVLLEDAIDVHDRHWKIHWMINFSQFSATMALNGAIAELGRRRRLRCPGACRAPSTTATGTRSRRSGR